MYGKDSNTYLDYLRDTLVQNDWYKYLGYLRDVFNIKTCVLVIA